MASAQNIRICIGDIAKFQQIKSLLSRIECQLNPKPSLAFFLFKTIFVAIVLSFG
jgi:hypothetical protein